MNATMKESEEAAQKMNELADNLILARNIVIGGLAVYAGFSIVRNFILMPFMRTYKFLSNQSRNLHGALIDKYGNDLVVIAGATHGLGPVYASYFAMLGFTHIVLIDSDVTKLNALKWKLFGERKNTKEKPFCVYTQKYDFSQASTVTSTANQKIKQLSDDFEERIEQTQLVSDTKDEQALMDFLKAIVNKPGMNKRASFIVNNLAHCQSEFSKMKVLEVSALTNNKVSNHSWLTNLCLRSLQALGASEDNRVAMINVGTLKEQVTHHKTEQKEFKNNVEEMTHKFYNTTVTYQVATLTLLVQ